MKKIYTILFFLLCVCLSHAQPYLDLLNIRFVNSPDAGIINRGKNKLSLQYFNVSASIPIQFNEKKDAVIISPYVEEWILEMSNPPNNEKVPAEKYYGLVLPVSYMKTINSKWTLLSTIIARINDYSIKAGGRKQIGAAVIASYKKSSTLTWKFGTYVNGDYFGLFVMPLLGIDWRINATTNLFGILPGALILEKKLKTRLYTGASFKAITNSFGKKDDPLYWRIDENLLGVYLDYYLTQSIVFTLESGHTILRRVRETRKGSVAEEKNDRRVNDNLYGKISLAYRIRL